MNHRKYFISLCDSGFLSFALTMFESLLKHLPTCKCFLICMDRRTFEYLKHHGPEWITPINLEQIETPELLEKKEQRTNREYCWTLSSHTFGIVQKLFPKAISITYIDADMYFLKSPQELFDELESSGKSILITDHHYAPEYDATNRSGKYCVQFLTIMNKPDAWIVINNWKSQCVDWCYARSEDGKFGDQMYLNDWPSRYESVVHVASPPERFLAPWNVNMVYRKKLPSCPIVYHFQGARLIGTKSIALNIDYKIPKDFKYVFLIFAKELAKNIDMLNQAGLKQTIFDFGKRGPMWYRKWIRKLKRNLILFEW